MITVEFWLGLVLGAGGCWLLARAWRRTPARDARAAANSAERNGFDQVQEVEEERDRLFNLSIDLLAIGDLTGRFLQVNPAWVRVLQWSRDEILERPLLELIHPEDRSAAAQSLEELREGKPVRDLELRTLCRDGTHRWIAWSSFPLTARRTVFTVARDFTERKHAERQLQRYQRRLQQLAHQLATVEERQQRRLAEILHDTLAQEIFAAQAKLDLLKQPERLDDPGAVLQEVATILEHASALTRSLTFELFPPALYEVGLDAALEWLCRSFYRTRGLLCRFECVGEIVDLPQDRRTLMYQTARELLGNVYKHAGAKQADMRLLLDPWQIELRVDDDGCGFDLDDLKAGPSAELLDDLDQGGFGLFNIRERLGPYGGDLVIGTSPAGGARVTVTLPLPDSED